LLAAAWWVLANQPLDLFLRGLDENQHEFDRIVSQPSEHTYGWDEAIMRFFIASQAP
jgi:hypothetical protein